MNDKLYYLNNSKKRYGQHFLNNKTMINQIINMINPKNEDIIVEIGPGLGALTKPLSMNVDNLIVIELDYHLANFLNKSSFGKKLTIFREDVMKFNFLNIIRENYKKIRICGNIPYNISTPLLFHLFKYINSIQDIHLMLQKEIVNRLIANKDSKEYSRLSVLVQYCCKVVPLIEVSPKLFTPSPKVDSIMVKLIPYHIPYYPAVDTNTLKYIVTQAFSQRRKIIRNSLNFLFRIGAFDELNIDYMLRAENISIRQYCKLANWFGKYKQFNK